MIGWDHRIEHWVVAHRVGALDPFVTAFTYAGTDGALWVVLAATVALAWRAPRVVVAVVAAASVSQIAAATLQALFGRARPNEVRLVSLPHSHSFPSGHAATSFACATVLASLIPRWRLPVIALAAAVAVSRLYVGVHYPSDVIAGALVGAAVGVGVLRALRQLESSRRQ
ncbi:MAG: phosphatase PAP2 family protein [Actinomycetes bacterium]